MLQEDVQIKPQTLKQQKWQVCRCCLSQLHKAVCLLEKLRLLLPSWSPYNGNDWSPVTSSVQECISSYLPKTHVSLPLLLFRCARSSIHTHWFLALDFHNNQFPDNQFFFSPLLTILHCYIYGWCIVGKCVGRRIVVTVLSLSQLGGCRQRTAGVAWEELQGKASPPPPTLSPTLTLLLPHHLQTKSRHGTPLTLRGWKELFVLGYLSKVCCLGGKYVGLSRWSCHWFACCHSTGGFRGKKETSKRK